MKLLLHELIVGENNIHGRQNLRLEMFVKFNLAPVPFWVFNREYSPGVLMEI